MVAIVGEQVVAPLRADERGLILRVALGIPGDVMRRTASKRLPQPVERPVERADVDLDTARGLERRRLLSEHDPLAAVFDPLAGHSDDTPDRVAGTAGG